MSNPPEDALKAAVERLKGTVRRAREGQRRRVTVQRDDLRLVLATMAPAPPTTEGK